MDSIQWAGLRSDLATEWKCIHRQLVYCGLDMPSVSVSQSRGWVGCLWEQHVMTRHSSTFLIDVIATLLSFAESGFLGQWSGVRPHLCTWPHQSYRWCHFLIYLVAKFSVWSTKIKTELFRLNCWDFSLVLFSFRFIMDKCSSRTVCYFQPYLPTYLRH